MESRWRDVSIGLLRWSGAAAVVVGGATLAACSAPPHRTGRAVQFTSQAASVAASPPAPPDAPWDLAADLKLLHAIGGPAPSQHFSGDLEAGVLANDEASVYSELGPARVVPEGAEVVETLRAPGEGRAKVYLAMRKRAAGFDSAGDDWEYAIATAGGSISERGKIPGCRRCHAEAPHAHLFGLAHTPSIHDGTASGSKPQPTAPGLAPHLP